MSIFPYLHITSILHISPEWLNNRSWNLLSKLKFTKRQPHKKPHLKGWVKHPDFGDTNRHTNNKKLRLCFQWFSRVQVLNFREERLYWGVAKRPEWNIKAFRSVLNRFVKLNFSSNQTGELLIRPPGEIKLLIFFTYRHQKKKKNLNYFFGFA